MLLPVGASPFTEPTRSYRGTTSSPLPDQEATKVLNTPPHPHRHNSCAVGDP
jgi:hypothetical protein